MRGLGSGRAGLTLVAPLLACVALCLTPAGANAASTKAPSAKAQVRSAFAQLTRDTRRLRRNVVSRRNRAALLREANSARRIARRDPCRANRRLRAFRRGLRRVRIPRRRRANRRIPTGAGSPRGQLQADLVRVQTALMALPRARRCGGGKRARVAGADTDVLESNERQLRLRVQLPPPTFSAHQIGGKDFLEMHMENMGKSGDVGEPGLPITTQFFGVPQGADVSVDVTNTQSYTIKGVELFPTQVQPVDQRGPSSGPFEPPDPFLFADKPFSIDRAAYRSSGPFPAQAANAGAMGALRNVRVGGVDAAGGQYNPRRNTLKVFTSIDVTVNFGGDNSGIFGPDTILSPWERPFIDQYQSLINFDTVRDRLEEFRRVFCGEELLIITSSELRPAANSLEAAREAQGYVTTVREVGSGAGQIGTTNTEIQTFIRSRVNHPTCLLKPSYVILFGNTAHVPTFLVPCSPGGNPDECNIASDLDYSLNGIGTDLFADVQLGRLPAPSLDAANALVTKLTTYEAGPVVPPGDDFYDHAAVTSYFQPPLICVLNEGASGTPNCNPDAPPVNAHWEIDYPANTDTRGFTITAERIRNAIAADGYTVDRLYTTDDEDVIPLNYWNGTPIPSHLRRPTFAWDANTTDFFNAYNEGRFVILHRDHGWPDGWAEPTLHSGHVPLFTNGTQQPVVFGINCSSAAFDTPAHPSFVELQVLRPDGGAIAGFGDTRVSPSFPNNHMALGFFDAMFPLTVADYGGPETRRLGDILIRGKQYMATQEGFEYHGSGDTYVEHYLYHLLGDPTMQMWSNPPQRFDPDRFRAVIKRIEELPFRSPRPDPPPYFVQFQLEHQLSQGAFVTLFRGAEQVGRGIVSDGVANIVPEQPVDEHDDLRVVVQNDGALPAGESVEGSGRKNPTSLTFDDPGFPSQAGNPNEFSGSISPAFAGATIRVVYTPNSPQNPNGTIRHTVTTNAQGIWRDQVNFQYYNPDTRWRAQAFFDGDRVYAASQSNVVTFNVGD